MDYEDMSDYELDVLLFKLKTEYSKGVVEEPINRRIAQVQQYTIAAVDMPPRGQVIKPTSGISSISQYIPHYCTNVNALRKLPLEIIKNIVIEENNLRESVIDCILEFKKYLPN